MIRHHEAGWLLLEDTEGRELRVRVGALNYMLWNPKTKTTVVEMGFGCGSGSHTTHTFKVKQTPAEIIERMDSIYEQHDKMMIERAKRYEYPADPSAGGLAL